MARRSVGGWRAWLLGALLVSGSIWVARAAEEAPVADSANMVRLPAAGEVPARMAAIEARLKELSAASSDPAATAGQSADELAEREALYRRWTSSLNAQARVLRRLQSTRQFSQQSSAEIQGWQGFQEPPPYPLAMVEQLRDQLAAQTLEEQSAQMQLSTNEDTLARSAGLLVERQKEQRLFKERVERASEGADAARSRWLGQLAELRVNVAETSLESAALSRLATLEALRARREYVKFLKQKLELAAGQTRFGKEDLDVVLAEVKSAQAALQQEINDALTAETSLRRALDQSRGALQKAQDEAIAGSLLAELRGAVEVAQARVEANEAKVEVLRTLMSLCNRRQSVWEDRFWASGSRTLSELRAKEDEYRPRMESLPNWRKLAESRLHAAGTQALAYGAKAVGKDLSAVEREQTRQIQAAWDERAGMYQRQLLAQAALAELNTRLCAELAARRETLSTFGRIGYGCDRAWAWAQSLWNTEIYVAEDSLIVDGQRIALSRSVTVGKLVVALLIFSLALLCAHFARGYVRRLSSRWFTDARQTQIIVTATGWVIAVTGLCLAMASVRIPWSVFAFAGGALAIGLGFGAQTVIKNVITGIIMVFGGNVRAGDIIEMDGHCGQVKQIGASRSLIRRGDGVEMLVPNSHFMEQNLINWTHSDNLVRQSVKVGVAYGSKAAQVSELMVRAASEHPKVLQQPVPDVIFEDFGDDGLIFVLRVWLQLGPETESAVVCSDLRHRISTLFEQAGISFPYPQRDVHLDSARPLEVRMVGAPVSATVLKS